MTTKKITKTKRKEIAAIFASMGGKATVRNKGKGYMKEIAARGGAARWAKTK